MTGVIIIGAAIALFILAARAIRKAGPSLPPITGGGQQGDELTGRTENQE